MSRYGVVGRVPAYHPGGPGSTPSGVKNFNFYPVTGCASFFCFLSCVVSDGDPDILLTTESMEAHRRVSV